MPPSPLFAINYALVTNCEDAPTLLANAVVMYDGQQVLLSRRVISEIIAFQLTNHIASFDLAIV